jgi:hypothetical protein
MLADKQRVGLQRKRGDCVVRRNLLGSIVGNWFYYQLHRYYQNPGDGWFRAHESWQWDPVDE